MPNDVLLFLLIFSAVALGWYLGWRSGRLKGRQLERLENPAANNSTQYIRGLNFLIDEEPDSAIDAVVSELDVNADTIEMHMALGNLLRKKGEVDRAIRIHQNLLARPSLNQQHEDSAQIELARDFVAAGLLDRAESLLQALVERNSDQYRTALYLLLDIYEDEHEWQSAIQTAERLIGRKLGLLRSEPPHTEAEIARLTRAQAHYLCELAEVDIEHGKPEDARTTLRQSLRIDPGCARACLLKARAYLQEGDDKAAVRSLRRVLEQDADYIPEAIAQLLQLQDAIGGPEKLLRLLQEIHSKRPTVSTVLAIAELLQAAKGDKVAADFIAVEVKRRPTLRGLQRLIALHIAHSSGEAQANLQLLKGLVDGLISGKPKYRCRECGFSGRQLHWLCPGCKTWGTVRPIIGIEGE